MSQVRMQEKRQSRILWPVMGFILVVALGTISWLIGPNVMSALPPNIQGMIQGLPGLQGEAYVSLFLFVVILSLGMILVAALAPKRAINITEKEMMKRRQDMLNTKALKERQRLKIARDNRRALREESARRETRER